MLKLFIPIMLVAALLGVIGPARAQTALDASGALLENAAGTNSTGSGARLTKNLSGLIGSIVKGVLGFSGTAFLVLTIYGGVLWMTASGKEEQVETAKKIITSAAIGVAICLSAYAITYFITARLKTAGEGYVGETPPKAVVCGHEATKPTGTCRLIEDCGKLGGSAINGSTCGTDIKKWCCSK